MNNVLKSINPFNGKRIETHSLMKAKDVLQSINDSQSAFAKWSVFTIGERIKYVESLIEILKENKKSLSSLITDEMGKVLKESRAEIEKCIWLCEFYANNSEKFLKSKRKYYNNFESKISYQPLGIILGIMPWNFPFWQVFRFAIPTLISGNTVLLKHASNVQSCSKKIEDLFITAGFPSRTFQSLIISSIEMEPFISHHQISGLSLTGSTEAGKAVGKIAGNSLKKTVFELGGNDPYIILSDANLDQTASACIKGRFLNAGQSCISAKRLIVVKDVLEPFTDLFIKKMQRLKMGDPLDNNTDIGPMVALKARDSLHDKVNASVEKGAEILLGGFIPEGKGSFYPPTLLSNVVPGMPAFDDELFGPVASIIAASTEEEAIQLANQSLFGLGAAVFTKNVKKGKKIAEEQIQAGICFVNDFVKSDPRIPFGGIKDSGYGRELGKEGIREFVNIKTIVTKLDE